MIASALIALFLGARSWYGTKKDVAYSFAFLQAAIFFWSFFKLIQWEIPIPEIKFEALKLQYFGIAFVPAFFYLFARALDKKPLKGLALIPVLAPGAATLLAIASDNVHHLFWSGDPVGVMPMHPLGGPIFWIFLVYSYIFMILSFAKLLHAERRSRGILKRIKRYLLVLFVLPFATNVVFILFFIDKTPYDPTPIVLAVSGLFLGIALSRFDLFDTVPYAKNVILESIDTPIIVVDALGFIVGANEEAEKFFASTSPLEGHSLSKVVPALAGMGGDGETREWSSGGIDYLISCYIVKQGRVSWRGRIFLFRDIRTVVKARRELEEAKAQAEAANAAKSAFVATVSHELRNPLNAIISLADLDLRADPPPAFRDDLEVIQSSGNILLGLVNDLLDLSKIEAGKMELEEVDFDLHEKVVSVLRAFRPTVDKKGLFLDIVIEAGTPRFVRGDPLRFGQVLMNLVSNAVKFTEFGAVTVSLGPAPPPELGAADPRNLVVRCSVRDTGMGIAPAKMPLLFHEFSQADSSVSRRFGGTGLGLSISKKLVSLFGGEIEVESEEGKGSLFSFTAKFRPGERAKEASEILPELPSMEARKLRILIVDDDPINTAVAKRYIERLGHSVSCAATGVSALEQAAAGELDLILLDLGLPDLDGFETCRRLRAHTSARPMGEVPIVAMTARAESGIRAACAAAGMTGCLPKPLDFAALDLLFERVQENLRSLGPRAAATVHSPRTLGAEGAVPAKPAEPGTPLVDVPALLERLEGDETFMHELLSIFVEEAPGRKVAFEKAIADQDIESIRKQAHALKGSSLTLCARPVGAAAGALESACIEAKRSGLSPSAAFPGIEARNRELFILIDDTAEVIKAIVGK